MSSAVPAHTDMHFSSLRWVGAFVAWALATACSSQPVALEPTATVSTLSSERDWAGFALGPNDVVRVGVYGHPELSTDGTRVDGEGNLSLPLVGGVHVAGLVTSAARSAVADAYAKYLAHPRIDLSIVEAGSRRCYVFGEVTRSGAIELDRPLNLLQGLALVGGFTAKADRAQVVLLRGQPEALEVAVLDFERPDARAFITLRPDDVVFVRRTNAGKFSDEFLPYLQGITSSLSSAATVLLIEDRLNGTN